MMLDLWRPTGIRHWRPFEGLDALERGMESSLEHPFNVIWRRAPIENMAWSPSIDAYEKDDAYFVRAELPGIKLEDVDISMAGNTLTIKGERKSAEDVTEDEWHRCEINYGPFSRSITLPEEILSNKIEASNDNGILEIRLPKVPEAKPVKIQIKAKQATKSSK
jgi:HSP20 family protein